MQDKDFDKLFSSKFEDFEAEPSPMAWENIADGLEDKKAVRPWTAYLSIAAGIAIMFTTGWWFLQKDSPSTLKHHNYANLVHKDIVKPVTNPASTMTIKQPEPTQIDKSSENRIPANRMALNNSRPHKTVLPANKAMALVVNKTDAEDKEPMPVVNPNPQLIAKSTTSTNTPVKPIMPDVQLSPKTVDAGVAAIPVDKPVVVVSTETEEPVKKRGIHNLGGLINALVSKVDKRQDKFIEFSDSDDDEAETNVTGVNMGPIRFKKQ